MALTYKVLGQSNPGATTATTLYTVPAATQAVCSTLVVCNQAGTSCTFRVAIRVAGVALDAKQYLFYDTALAANSTYMATVGLTLGAGDIVTVYMSSAFTSVSLFGSEIA